ncbi:MAG: VCBS repeat-containing protein [Bryobacterales bacterium]|nr:VCBS repeat-containing protein [Bryobacterales bacterium]
MMRTWAFALLSILLPGTLEAEFALRTQELMGNAGVFMAVLIEDINQDGKPDIVAVQEQRIVWFENPTWERHLLADDTMAQSYVCAAAQDIDGDGKVDLAVGSAWRPADRKTGGVIQWMRRTEATGRARWQAFPISEEPTTHRMRWLDANGDGRRELVVAPLHGRARGATPGDEGVRILVFRPPAKPESETWKREVASDALHVVHNLTPIAWKGEPGEALLTASREGLMLHRRAAPGTWRMDLLGEGSPGEVKLGRLGSRRVAVGVEPWHGAGLVVYRETDELPWERMVVDTQLEEGHAVAWADLDGDGIDELIAGWRRGKYGVAMYRWNRGDNWQKQPIDNGMATEDVAVGDLNGDGLPEIVAVGRATGNARIYWNEGNVREAGRAALKQ